MAHLATSELDGPGQFPCLLSLSFPIWKVECAGNLLKGPVLLLFFFFFLFFFFGLAARLVGSSPTRN